MKLDSRIMIISIVLFVSATSPGFAYCPETLKEMYFPAVLDENSSQMIMVQIQTAEKINSNGYQTFLNTNPLVGYDTQDSINIASDVARLILKEKGINTSECNILISFYSPREVEYIDGPSAGAGLAMLMMTALENKTIRDDITMTGTIETDRTVGSIGGLALKGEAAYKHGYRIFLTPMLSNSEKIELLMLKNYYDLKIIQVENVEQAYSIATTPKTKNLEENVALSPDNLLEYKTARLEHWYADRMRNITEGMINNTKEINQFPLPYRANFEIRILNAENALNANQFYSAANIAFLLSIDEGVSKFTKKNMINEYIETTQCISSFKPTSKTIDTFEVIGPAEARYFWSVVKLNKTIPSEGSFWEIIGGMHEDNGKMGQDEFIAPLFSKYKDILNAKYWCLAAKDMNLYGTLTENQNGTAIDESSLKNYTENAINELEPTIDELNSDASFHLETAKAAMKEGKYVAALVDAAYIKSYDDIIKINETEFETYLDSLLKKNYTYIWADMFRNHAETIAEEDPMSALRVALIGNNIETYFKNAEFILSGIEGNQTIESPSPELVQKSEEMLAYQIFAIATVLGGIVFIAYVLKRTRLLETDRNEGSESKKKSKK